MRALDLQVAYLLDVIRHDAAVVGSYLMFVRCYTRGLLANNYCLVGTLLHDKVGREAVLDHLA